MVHKSKIGVGKCFEENFMLRYIQKKRVLFVTTKNVDYIRNTQEIALIAEHAQSYTVIASAQKNYFVRILSVYWRLFMTCISDFDTIFVGFAPQLVLPLFRQKCKQVNIVEDFFISLYDTFCCDRKKFKPEGIVGKLLHYLDEKTLACADAVFCDTNAHGRYFIEEFHVKPDKLTTMYLQADSTIYHPIQVTRPVALENKFIVLYFGSILPLQGIDVVLQAFVLLSKHAEQLYFYCIGPIRDKKISVSCPTASCIKYIDWLPQPELARLIAMADLCLAGHFNDSIDKAKRTIPGKAFIYRAMNKPMILGDNPANHEFFSDAEDVIFVEMGNPYALAHAIIQFKKRAKPLCTICNK